MSGRKEKSRDMDLLKSILDTDAKQGEDSGHVVLSLPGRRSPRRHQSPRARARTISSDTDTSTLDGEERWAKRTKHRRVNSAKRQQHVVTHKEMLDDKYLELRQLLYDQFRKNKFRLDPHLVAKAKELMRRYQLAQDGQLPVEAILGMGNRKQAAEDAEEYILIDGTGPDVRTRRVTFAPDDLSTTTEDTITNDLIAKKELALWEKNMRLQRGRPPQRKARHENTIPEGIHVVKKPPLKPLRQRSPAKSHNKSPSARKAPRNNCSTPSSSAISSSRDSSPPRRKSRDYYSSDSGSSSRSRSSSCSSSSSPRSRSRSKSRDRKIGNDNHLKNSENPKLLEWLKEKNKLHRTLRKENRKKKRDEKLKKEEEARARDELQQKSEEKVKEWMVKKKKEQRLLRRRQMVKNCVSESSIKSNDSGSTQTGDGSSQQSSAATTPRVPIPKKSYPRPISATLDVTPAPKPMKKRPASAATKLKKTAMKPSGPQEKVPPPVPFTTPENTADTLVTNGIGDSSENKTNVGSTINSDANVQIPHTEEGSDDKEESKKSEEKVDTQSDEMEACGDNAENVAAEDLVQCSDGPVESKQKKRPTSATKARKRIGSDEGDYTLPRQSALFAGPKPPEKTEPNSPPNESTSDEDTTRRPCFEVPSPPRPSVSPAPPAKSLTSDVKELVEAVAQETEAVLAPPSEGNPSDIVPTPPSKSIPPRPKSSSRAYREVKYTQRSWDNFSDRVWEDLNEEEEEQEEEKERPEPQGSDEPESAPSQETGAPTQANAAAEDSNNNVPPSETPEAKGDSENTEGVFLTSLIEDTLSKSAPEEKSNTNVESNDTA